MCRCRSRNGDSPRGFTRLKRGTVDTPQLLPNPQEVTRPRAGQGAPGANSKLDCQGEKIGTAFVESTINSGRANRAKLHLPEWPSHLSGRNAGRAKAGPTPTP